MTSYYSQHGEDYIAWQLFQGKPPGYFVEVGALDGTRFSNTYSFEREGWTGICIEAHPDYIDLLKQNRPRSHCVFAAVAETDGEVTFYTNSRGSLSTLDPSLEDEFRRVHGHFFTGFKPVTVPMKTLNQILDEVCAPTSIDLISIDVEGAEFRVLQGFDLSRFQPRVIILEATGNDQKAQLDAYLVPQGYHWARTLASNHFYCRFPEDVEPIRSANLDHCVLSITPHPLDRQAESTQHQLVPRIKRYLRKLQSKLQSQKR